MKHFLRDAGYVLDGHSGVWADPVFSGIAYSDGDEVEQRLAQIIAQASDLSVLSDELKPHMTDWPSLYHLSSNRANIMRPFADRLRGAHVLEVGAGCGAITRYLGESGANVLALEGSLRRAAIARSRTRDLPGVEVLAQRFDQFEGQAQFEIVTLIGVLEYANQFVPGETPALTMLRRARALLKPGGILVLAIENQLGLKYWAGAPEDHLGVPMYGLEGRYRSDQPQTYGRQALQTLVADAGFACSDVMSPLPDYKLPTSILMPGAFACVDFDAAALACQSVRRDPQLPSSLVFAPELVWPVVMENGLGADLANSLLVVAGVDDAPLLDPAVLAHHYTVERAAAFCKETAFKRLDDGRVEVHCRRLEPSVVAVRGRLLAFELAACAPYVRGEPMSNRLTQLVMRDGWSIEEVGDFLREYLRVVAMLVGCTHDGHLPATLPGRSFDLTPQNIVCDGSGRHHAIDLEWSLREDMPVGWLLLRVLLLLVHGTSSFGRPATPFEPTRRGFFLVALRSAGLDVNAEALDAFAQMEQAVQIEVTGRSADELAGWCADAPLRIRSCGGWTSENVKELPSGLTDTARWQELLDQRDHHVAVLQATNLDIIARHAETLDERDRHLAAVQASLAAVQASWSWKLGRPLRRASDKLTKLLRKARVLAGMGGKDAA
jgi:SAM-dependent methyltransferase